MSKHLNPLEEERLRHFLRQYRPLSPPADSGLEEQILQAVATHPLHGRTKRSWRWVGISLLAGALLGWVGYQRWQVQVVAQETEALESFLVSTWGSLLSPEGTETETWWIERDPAGS
ncbi:MAG TPA: hypothetical protein IGR15_11970 [Synechococcus sp. M44_DOE_062]|nr:hypothetical protein [Synechococcus sp. M44_DOE_062]